MHARPAPPAGNPRVCSANKALGGWGPRTVGPVTSIPNRNVFIINNVIYNPPGTQSQVGTFFHCFVIVSSSEAWRNLLQQAADSAGAGSRPGRQQVRGEQGDGW